jgi:hypothetical protein
MDRRFDTRRRLVYVTGVISGPYGETRVNLALDTGAARTIIRPALLRFVGCDPAGSTSRARIVSATGEDDVSFVLVDFLRCIGQTRPAFHVAAHDLPRRFEGDGLLGLDFFRGRVLTLDFARGRIALGPPRPWWRFWA